MRTAFFSGTPCWLGLLTASLGAGAPVASGSHHPEHRRIERRPHHRPRRPPRRPKADKLTLATWFGPGFYGHATACGQTMSPTIVGVASRTLPCGTLVQIGYRGHLLTVPVLDRGPYGTTAPPGT